MTPVVRAAFEDYGLDYVPESLVREHIDEGRLVSVLKDWRPPFPSYFLFYPHRRRSSLALGVIADTLQYYQ
ncbi:hypothetical protein [Halomonas nigrificans]|uniref:LysR substrate-binding domain-containing protein n=1 Tax=Vreelandella nigrificans TaxID=2042704 RepID=A0A2A4HT84_9GAMM|nr:hypothetical protein CPA45_02495 [Halomonas nigrificans]